MPEPALAAVVLAAGASRRLGQPKQLVELDGEPLLRRIVRLAVEAGCYPVVVVLGMEEDRCRAVLRQLLGQVQVVVNSNWAEGMSTSLRVGLARLGVPGCEAMVGQPPEAVLVLVCDQVQLTIDSLPRLLKAHCEGTAPVTAARYSGRLGVPAIFRAESLPALAQLTGDQGARRLLEAWADRVLAVDMPEAAFELDTPEELAMLLKSSQGSP